MKERMRRRLRTFERALRPRSSAMRQQAAITADAIDALRAATDAMNHATRLLAHVAMGGDEHARLPFFLDDRNVRYDRETAEVIRRVLGRRDSALDVGAHAGDVLAQIVAAAPKGRHHAFEPIPALAADLRARFPQVQVHEVALADTTGEATFHHVVTNPSYSGLKQRRFDREGEQVELTTVRTARLDDLVPRQTPVRFVKIDVEGAEEGVLRGGLETIRANRPFIVFEHGLGGSEQYGTRPEALDELLRSVGLEISLMERWLAGQPPLTREELVRQFERAENYYFIASARV